MGDMIGQRYLVVSHRESVAPHPLHHVQYIQYEEAASVILKFADDTKLFRNVTTAEETFTLQELRKMYES